MADDNISSKVDSFLTEKTKDRPINKRKLIRRTVITASMAVVFGLIACFTFLVLQPVISEWLYPKEKPQIVTFPEDLEEMSPEEMLTDMMQAEKQNQTPAQSNPEPMESEGLEDEQIRELLSEVEFDKNSLIQMYQSLNEYADQLQESMVTVTGLSSNVDWFNNANQSTQETMGVLVADNGLELLILVDYSSLKDAESLSVAFHNNATYEATLKSLDKYTNLGILAVSMDNFTVEEKEEISMVNLGSSGGGLKVGTPVIALGSPMGVCGSFGSGMITAMTMKNVYADANYKLIQTDINGSQNGKGFLFNMDGSLIGILTDNRTSPDLKGMLCAYGITELKKKIEKLSNAEDQVYLGIHGVDVTRAVNQTLGVPVGAYVTEVDMSSPARKSGIQTGDVITSLAGYNINTFSAYMSTIMKLAPEAEIEMTIMRQSQDEYKEMKITIVPEALR